MSIVNRLLDVLSQFATDTMNNADGPWENLTKALRQQKIEGLEVEYYTPDGCEADSGLRIVGTKGFDPKPETKIVFKIEAGKVVTI